jgi:glycosyltransferase involved in cell wall biosynthesis
VLVNTSAREALPYTFLEALAYGVAVLSPFDPDGVASRFGAVADGDRFEDALESLLRDGTWRTRGGAGTRWVRDTFSVEESVRQHLELYEALVAAKRQGAAGSREERVAEPGERS